MVKTWGLQWLLERSLALVEDVLAGVASIVLLFVMFIISADVLMRYFLNQPLEWVFDLMSLYLVMAAFFLPLSYVLRRREHLAVTFFAKRMSGWLRGWLTGPLLVISAVLFLIVALSAGSEAYHAWDKGFVVAGAIAWPTWISSSLVSISLIPLCCRLFLIAARDMVASKEHSE